MPIGNDPLSSLLDFATGLDQQQPAAPQPTQPQNDIGSLLDFATGMDQPAPVQQPQPVGPSPEDMAAMQAQQDRKRWISENPALALSGSYTRDSDEFVRGPDGNIVFDPQTKMPKRMKQTKTFTPAERLMAAQQYVKNPEAMGSIAQGTSWIPIARGGFAMVDAVGTYNAFKRIEHDIDNNTNTATDADYIAAGRALNAIDPGKPPETWFGNVGHGIKETGLMAAEFAGTGGIAAVGGKALGAITQRVLGKVATKAAQRAVMKVGGAIAGRVGADIALRAPGVLAQEVARLPAIGSGNIGAGTAQRITKYIGVNDEYGKPLETYVAKQPDGVVGAAARAIAMQLGEQLGERGGDVAFERIAKGLKLALLKRMGPSKVAQWVAKGMDPDYPFKDFVQNKMKIGSLETELPEETLTEILQYPAMTPEERNQTKIKKVWDGRFQEAWDQLSQEAVTLAAIPIGWNVVGAAGKAANYAGSLAKEQLLQDRIYKAAPNIPEAPKGTQWDSDSLIDEVIRTAPAQAMDFAKAENPSRSALQASGMLDTLKEKPEWYEQASNAGGRAALWTSLRRKLYQRDPGFQQDQDTFRQDVADRYANALPKDIVPPNTEVGENGWPVYSWGSAAVSKVDDGWALQTPAGVSEYETFDEAYKGVWDYHRQQAQQKQQPPPQPPQPPQGGPPPTPPPGPVPTAPPIPPNAGNQGSIPTTPPVGTSQPTAPPQKITGRKLTTQQQTRGLTPQQFGPAMPPMPYQRFPQRQGTPQEYLRPTPATAPVQSQPKNKVTGRQLPMTQTEARRMEPEFGENPLAGMRQAFPQRQQPESAPPSSGAKQPLTKETSNEEVQAQGRQEGQVEPPTVSQPEERPTADKPEDDVKGDAGKSIADAMLDEVFGPSESQAPAAPPKQPKAPAPQPPQAPKPKSDLKKSTEARKEKTAKELEDAAKAFRDAFGGSRLSAGVDPEKMRVAAQLAKAAISHGISKFADFVAYVVDLVGEANASNAAEYIEVVWDRLRARPEFDHVDEAGSVQDVVESISAAKSPKPESKPEPKLDVPEKDELKARQDATKEALKKHGLDARIVERPGDATYFLTGNTYKHREKIKEIKGRRFNSIDKSWELPSQAAAEQLLEALGDPPVDQKKQPPVDEMPERVRTETKEPGTEKIKTARWEYTPEVDTTVIPDDISQHLHSHQKIATGAAWKAMHEDERGFLLASGTGAGKTRSILAVAKMYMTQENRPVLVVAPNEVFGKPAENDGKISGSYHNDAKAMGIDYKYVRDGERLQNGKLYYVTYNHFHKFNLPSNAVLVLDESHSLKNVKDSSGSQRGKTGQELIDAAHAVLFASATPADKPHHIAYMGRVGILEGRSAADQLDRLGMREVAGETYKNGKRQKYTTWAAKPFVSHEQLERAAEALFTRLTARGKVIKHEISFDGLSVKLENVYLPDEAYDMLDRLHNVFTVRLGNKKLGLMHQRRQLETYKIEKAADMVEESYKNGRSVVVFTSRINKSDAVERVYWTNPATGERELIEEIIHASSEGTAPALRRELAARGITDIVELHGNSEDSAADAMRKFQSGQAKVIIATVESGGTGINLDDTVGNAPRDVIVITPPFDAVGNVQALGRVWRVSTKSRPRFFYLTTDTATDQWNLDVTMRKMRQLGAVVSGEVGNMMAREFDAPLYPRLSAVELREQLKNAVTEEVEGNVKRKNLTDQQLDDFMALVAARAASAGVPLDDYVGATFAAIVQGGEADPAALMQNRGDEKKGSVEFLEDGRAIIRAYGSATDVSTLVHELGHIFRRQLDDTSRAVAEKYAEVEDGRWTLDAEEKFAVAFEKYLSSGFSPTKELQSVFERLRNWLVRIYRVLVGNDKRFGELKSSPLDIKVSGPMMEVFDKLLTSADAPKRNYSVAVVKRTPTGWTVSGLPPQFAEKLDGKRMPSGVVMLNRNPNADDELQSIDEEAARHLEKEKNAKQFGLRFTPLGMMFDADADDIERALDEYADLRNGPIRDRNQAMGELFGDGPGKAMRMHVLNATRFGTVDKIPGFDSFVDQVRNAHEARPDAHKLLAALPNNESDLAHELLKGMNLPLLDRYSDEVVRDLTYQYGQDYIDQLTTAAQDWYDERMAIQGLDPNAPVDDSFDPSSWEKEDASQGQATAESPELPSAESRAKFGQRGQFKMKTPALFPGLGDQPGQQTWDDKFKEDMQGQEDNDSGEPDTLFAAAGFAPGRGNVEARQLEPDNPLRKSFAPWAASKPESVAGKDLLGRQEVDLKRKQPAMGPIHAWDMISKAINAVFMFMDTNTTRRSPANYRPAGAVITSKSPNLMSMNAHEVGHHVSHILADAANLDPKKKVPTGQGRRVMSWHEAILGKQAADLLVELTDKNNPGVVVSYASAKTPEEGMAEFIRKYIEQYDLLEYVDPATGTKKFQPLIDAVENALQAHAPDVLKTIRDASRFMRNYYNADAEYRFKVSQESLSPMSLTVNKVVNWLIGLGTTWVGGGLKMDADEKRAAWGLVAQQLKTRGKGLSGWMKAYRKGVQDVRQWRLSRKNGRPENEAAWEANLNAVQNDVIQALRGEPRKGIRVPIYNLNIFNTLTGRAKQHTLDAADLKKLKDVGFDLTDLEGVAFQSGDFAYIKAPSPAKDIFEPLHKDGLHEKFATYAIMRAMLFRHRKYSEKHSNGNPDYWKTADAAVAGWHPYPGMRDSLQPVDADNLVKEYEAKYQHFPKYFALLNKFYKQLLLLDLMSGNKTVEDLENMVKAHREVDQNGQVVEQYMHLPRKFDTNSKDYWSPENIEEIGDVVKQARGSHRSIVDTWKALQRRTRQAISTYAQTMAFNSKLKFRDSLTPRGHGVTNKVALAIRNDLQSEIIRLHPDSKIVATLRDADLNSKEGERLIQGILDEINAVPGNQNIATKDDLNFVDSYGNPYVNVPIRRAGKPESPFHVVVYFDPAQRGKEQYALIRDPALLKVVTKRGQGNRHVAGVRKVVAAFHMPLVRAIVHSFGYMVRNAIRDLGAQQTNTRFDDAELRKMFGAAAPFENWYNWGKFRNDPQFEESQGIRSELTRLLNEPERENRKGVTGTGYRYVDALTANFEDAWTLGKSWFKSEPQLRAEYDIYDYPASIARAAAGLLTLPLDAVWTAPIIASQFSEMIEAAPRQGTFISKKRQGATDIEARQAAMESTGYFAQKPAGPLVREFAASVPFFNPNMQATYQSVRDAFDADPEVMGNWLAKRFAALTIGALQGAAAIGTATLFLGGGGDDEEKALFERMEQRSQAMKDRYGWIVLPDGTPVQVAFGEGLDGAMRALGFNYVMVERGHDRLYDRSMYQTAKTVFDKAVGESPLGVDPGTSLPLVAKWATELGFNESFYQDRPIEPDYLTKSYPENPENRYTPGTDPQAFVELSRLLAAGMGRYTPSPPQIKHLVTTFAGAESVNLMSHVSNALFGTKDRTRTPFIGQVGFGEYTGYSAEAVQELRRRDAAVDSLKTNYRAIVERGGDGDAVLKEIGEKGAAQDMWKVITDLLQKAREAKQPEERKRLEKEAVDKAMDFLQNPEKFRRQYILNERIKATGDEKRPRRNNEKLENYQKKVGTAKGILRTFGTN